MQLVALNDFDLPGSGLRGAPRGLRSLIAAIGKDEVDKREETTRASVE